MTHRDCVHQRKLSAGSTLLGRSGKIITSALLLALIASPAWARVYYVSTNGDNRSSGTSLNDAWRSINYAMSSSSPVGPGDVVQVAAGSYREDIDIKISGTSSAPITLRGADGVVILDPTPSSGKSEAVMDIIGARNIVVEKITVKDAYFFGIAVRGSENVVLRQVRTINTGGSGILATKDHRTGAISRNVKILNSEVAQSCNTFSQRGQGGQEAISVVSVDGFEVAYTKVYGGKKEGITAKVSSRNGSIHHNTVYGQRKVGFYVDGIGGSLSNVQVHNNLSYNNEHGIVVVNEGKGHTENVAIYNNVIHSNRGRGIGVAAWGVGPDHDINDVRIINNTVAKNGTIGILIDNPEASNIVVRNNVSYMNRFAAQIKVVSGRVVVERNVVTNPGFRNAAANDFSLVTSSPAVDAGMTHSAPRNDFLNRARPQGAGPDVGAFEVR